MKRSEAEWEQLLPAMDNNINGVAGGRHRAALSRNLLSTPKQQYLSIPAVNCKPAKVNGAKKAKLAGGCRVTSGSDDQSDDNDDELFEFENGLSDPNTIDIKRMRRMISNRESARRSRTRKQAQQIQLELQVDQLRGESAALYKQFTDANHQFTAAVSDNRVLKSNVEAIRIKVKMAEDMLTRGSLPCGLDTADMNMMDHIQENGGCLGNFQGGDMGVGMNAGFDNLQSVISSDITSCETDVWSWGSPTADVISKLQIS